jgi:hypothetical protein
MGKSGQLLQQNRLILREEKCSSNYKWSDRGSGQ